jgi:hypothetical protein
LGDRVVTDTRGAVEPKMRALQDSVTKRLGITPRPAVAPDSGAPATKKN